MTADDAPEPEQAPPPAAANAADPKALKEQRRRATRASEQKVEFWRRALGTEIGREIIWELLNGAGHFLEERFECGPNGFPQPEASWYRAGERDFALRFYHTLLRCDHEGVYKMHLEWDARFAKPKRPQAQTGE